jgi:DNA-binding transcriptional regulator YiaG
MIESNFRVLEFSKDDLRSIIKDAVSAEVNKILSAINVSNNNSNNELLSRKEVSKLLNVSLVTLNKWEKLKILIPSKVGGRVLYIKGDVYKKLRDN